MMGHLFCMNHLRGTDRQVHRKCLSLLNWNCKSKAKLSERTPTSIQNFCTHKTLTPSIYLNVLTINKPLFRNTWKSDIRNLLRRKDYTSKDLICNRYSTSAPDDLSLANEKVQEYLTVLRARYKAAMEHTDDTNVKTARTLQPVMHILEAIEKTQSDIKELQSLAKDSKGDEELWKLANLDLQEAESTLQDLEEEFFSSLVPEEPVDNTDVILEVSAGVGGQEAMLFSQEIFEMYQGYAAFMGWQSETTDYETTDIGGLRRGIANISGESVYQLLKYEGGIHRVQRVPKTEKAGRIHTSTVSVAVMAQPSEIDIQILDKDVKIETKRASGAGGQHVNTTDSAVRMIHLPTGISVESQKERSQHLNKDQCLKKLRALLYQQELDHNINQYTSNRRLQVGTRSRSEKIRTYNYPQDRVTDHRVGVSVHNLSSFLDGMESLHSLICQLVEEGKKETLQEIISGARG
ncbi:peptide chain release factor 1-like, mitochondrial [Homarus americanus]|uniref:Peptide chain release factor 1-like-like n=1 Tax=Homarus americanus TaxID=6706 RepID=A0A8J5JWT8_HOMAM|nr:peptide chain release factor 1-like, mitochondrial [Homarus americanus]XP_042228706.1 peptide chain release factor 1-like, mitochondrial [Homarus americanus]XP_042228707.1 peptide chain release factor 1-like, mitochondrial [Homarus americanus]XP_042228708.1 peptide chain release factor 1-like, mitochondrial [Homarus americanus]XP_042228709.1 peptide chain release factor 1-like, mitochondrial [Homarus americanus]XP_042228710.1 peptide chain release factor 1-like, mitochondrial [Homarus ameri